MVKKTALQSFKEKMLEEFPGDFDALNTWFGQNNFLSILNFLDREKPRGIDLETVLNHIESRRTEELREYVKELIEKRSRIDELFATCAQLWAKQITNCNL